MKVAHFMNVLGYHEPEKLLFVHILLDSINQLSLMSMG